jgi:hypothetical protein
MADLLHDEIVFRNFEPLVDRFQEGGNPDLDTLNFLRRLLIWTSLNFLITFIPVTMPEKE